MPPAARYRSQTYALWTPGRQLVVIWMANSICGIYRRNHFTRPLEEAIQTHHSQWPKGWQGKNPLSGGRSFATMTPEERVCIYNDTKLDCNTDNACVLVGIASIVDFMVTFIIRGHSGQDQGILQAGAPRRRPQPTSICSTLGP